MLSAVKSCWQNDLFLMCPYSRAAWFGTRFSIRTDLMVPNTIVEWLSSLLEKAFRAQSPQNAGSQQDLLEEPIMVSWSIYSHRNKVLFEGREPNVNHTLSLFLTMKQKISMIGLDGNLTGHNTQRPRNKYLINQGRINVVVTNVWKNQQGRSWFFGPFFQMGSTLTPLTVFQAPGKTSKQKVFLIGLRNCLEVLIPHSRHRLCIQVLDKDLSGQLNAQTKWSKDIATIAGDIRILQKQFQYLVYTPCNNHPPPPFSCPNALPNQYLSFPLLNTVLL